MYRVRAQGMTRMPFSSTGGQNNKVMEEKNLVKMGFVEIGSSDLFARGGASEQSVFEKIFVKLKALINFIADYVPRFIDGFKEGFSIF